MREHDLGLGELGPRVFHSMLSAAFVEPLAPAPGNAMRTSLTAGLPSRREGDMPDARVEMLLKIPLFSRLPARQVRKILKGATEDRYDQGVGIVKERGPGNALFVIIEGTATVEHQGRVIARRSEGDFFGEISVIDGRRRTATVSAGT